MSSALIVGVGGLGCAAAPLLHQAGVKLTLCDFDQVEERNLGRQGLYTSADLERLKVDAARDRLPGVQTTHQPFEPGMVHGHDVVLDCTDEPGTRALIHHACLEANIPLIWGAVAEDMGQLVTVLPGKGPCLRCLWPAVGEPTPCDANTDAAALLATGEAQATAALAVLDGNGQAGTLRLLGMPEQVIPFARRPDCPACHNL